MSLGHFSGVQNQCLMEFQKVPTQKRMASQDSAFSLQEKLPYLIDLDMLAYKKASASAFPPSASNIKSSRYKKPCFHLFTVP